MIRDQRYVSKELTHFGGGSRPDGTKRDQESQYEILLKILREGCLRHRLDTTDIHSPARIAFNESESFSDRKVISVDAVCFCDIPVIDFPIHIRKYSSFGISFLKSFLIKQGATPVFYIAKDSLAPDPPTDFRVLPQVRQPRTRAQVFDVLIREYLGSHSKLKLSMMQELTRARTIDEYDKPFNITMNLLFQELIRTHFMSFCIPFDSSKDDDDKENYYMEREWRVIGPVTFTLDDVYRVIIPESYSKRFREDVMDYDGQITFADA